MASFCIGVSSLRRPESPPYRFNAPSLRKLGGPRCSSSLSAISASTTAPVPMDPPRVTSVPALQRSRHKISE